MLHLMVLVLVIALSRNRGVRELWLIVHRSHVIVTGESTVIRLNSTHLGVDLMHLRGNSIKGLRVEENLIALGHHEVGVVLVEVNGV